MIGGAGHDVRCGQTSTLRPTALRGLLLRTESPAMAVSLVVEDRGAELESLAALAVPARLGVGRAGAGAGVGAGRAARDLAGDRGRSDEELSRLGGAGMEELFRRHDAALSRFCLGLMGQADEAADAMQSVWERALVAFARRPGAILKVRPWLYTVARNECLDRMRAGAGRRTVDIEDVELAGGLSAEEQHLQRFELEVLLGDLARLSERQRSALVLREFAGFEADELASELGTSPSRALGLVAEARRGLVERRSGRGLPCSSAQSALTGVRRRSGALQAHLDSCSACQGFEQRRRGRALSSLAITPFLFVRDVAERLSALVSPAPELAKVAAVAVIAGSAAIGGGMSLREDAGSAPQRSAEGVVAAPVATDHQGAIKRLQRIADATTDRRRSAERLTATRQALSEIDTPSRAPHATPPTPTPDSPAAAGATNAKSSPQPAGAAALPATAAALQELQRQLQTTGRSALDLEPGDLPNASEVSSAVKDAVAARLVGMARLAWR